MYGSLTIRVGFFGNLCRTKKKYGEYLADLIEELTSAKAAMPKQIVNHQLPHSSVVYNLPGVLQFE